VTGEGCRAEAPKGRRRTESTRTKEFETLVQVINERVL
jgi:hypothetical protein